MSSMSFDVFICRSFQMVCKKKSYVQAIPREHNSQAAYINLIILTPVPVQGASSNTLSTEFIPRTLGSWNSNDVSRNNISFWSHYVPKLKWDATELMKLWLVSYASPYKQKWLTTYNLGTRSAYLGYSTLDKVPQTMTPSYQTALFWHDQYQYSNRKALSTKG